MTPPATSTITQSPHETMEAPQFIHGTHVGPHGSRDYKLFTPSHGRHTELPLLVMLHGCHQDSDDFALGTRMNEHAQAQSCIVVYPAQAARANSAKCWNWYDPGNQQREQGEPAIIAELTQHIVSNHPIATGRIFIAGFSAGAAMAATVAVNYPELYTALGIHSGVPHGAARDFMSAMFAMQHGVMASYAIHPTHRQIPTIVFHGDEDNIIHSTHAAQFIGGNRHAQWPSNITNRHVESVARQKNRYGYTRTVQLGDDQRIFSEHWIVHGGGHAWYGGNAAGTYIDPHGPDAAGEMMRFFANRK